MSDRAEVVKEIADNIARFGCHIYLVAAKDTPRFAYSIGLSQSLGHELILAGAIYYSDAAAAEIINAIARLLRDETVGEELELDGLGRFRVQAVDESWVHKLMLGAVDLYGDVSARQITPIGPCWTADTPDLSRAYSAHDFPAWEDVQEDHPEIPTTAAVITNLDALRGASVTEAARWESGLWEMFAGPGPDVSPEDVRKLPIRTMAAIDPSLEPVLKLEVGEALWRESGTAAWREWKSN